MKNTREHRSDWHERIGLAMPDAIGIALSTGVVATLAYFLIALGPLLTSPSAYAQAAPPAAGVQLEAGIEKETVDGDLNAAISIYQKIASDVSAPREVRAKALLRLAGCEEKLGKQAKQVYEQIVRDYADQPAAAQARTRLAAIKQQEHPAQPPTMTARKIEWAKLGYMTAYDTDGEHAIFMGSEGDLFHGDVAGHNQHLIFKSSWLGLLGWWASQDLSMVALVLRATANHPYILAVVKMDGTGYRELIRDDQVRIFERIALSVNYLDVSWSWDHRYLAVSTGEGGRLIVVDVSNGSHRELVRSDSDWLWTVRFSPDGRFVAYETTPPEMRGGISRIYVVPVRGGEPQLAKEVPQLASGRFRVLMDWATDGRYLITKEVQEEKSALYLLPMKDGLPAGPSLFVRSGDFDNAHTTLSGALVYEDRTATVIDVDAFLASIDANGHIGAWRRLSLRGGVSGEIRYPWPSFSPDGAQIAYRAAGAAPSEFDLVVLDLLTGQERIIYQSSEGMLACQYSNGIAKVFCTLSGRNGGTKTDLFSVDDNTGAVEKIASLEGSKILGSIASDGTTFYLSDQADKYRQLKRWELNTQQETLVAPKPVDGRIIETPSTDGSWLLRTVWGDSLSARPISGGDWKTLVSGVNGLASFNDTSQDGNWAFYLANDLTGKAALFRVPTTGGAAERIGNLPSVPFWGQFTSSADGHQILAINTASQKYDLWVLENFEPREKR